MKKRILSVLMAIVMLIGMVPTAFAATPKVKISIEASKTTPSKGEEITFTLSIQTFEDGSVSGFTLPIDVPSGLTYIANSGKVDEGFKSVAKAEGFEWIEAEQQFFCSSSALDGLSGLTTKRVIGTFKCVVSNEAIGVYNVGVSGSVEDKNVEPITGNDLLIEKATVTIPKAPITSVSFTLDAPAKGTALPSLTALGSGYTGVVEWYKGNTATGEAVTGSADANQVYTAKVTLTAKTTDGESFDASLNGQTTAEGYKIKFVGTDKLELTKTFPKTADKDTPVCVAPTGVTATFGSALSTITLTNPAGNTAGKWYWMDDAQKVGNVKDNPHTYKAKFVPTDTANFSTVENIDVTVTATRVVLNAGYPIMIPIEVDFTGSAIKPIPTIKTDNYGDELVLNQDYKITKYEDNTNVGTGKIYIEPLTNGNYSFTAGIYTFTIKAGTSSISITGDPSKTYDGNVVADPAVSTSGSTGTVTYTYYTNATCTTETTTANSGAASNGTAPKNAGDYWVKATLAADSNHDSATSVAKKFTISPRNISEVTVASIADQEYTGSSIKPTLTVTYNGAPLTSDTDYTVEYTSNLNVGTATATIKAKTGGNFTGKKAEPFKIKAKAISPVVTVTGSYEYTGDPITPTYKVEITSGGMELPTNQYDAEVSNNTNAGNGNIKITAKANGNYSFSEVNKTFTIAAKDVSGLPATISDQTTIKGVGEFVDPVIKGVKDEVLTGTLTYAYDGVSGKTHDDVVAMLKTKATNDVVTLDYTFTPSSSNYTGTKTGNFTVTVKDIEFLVGTAPATVANTLTVKSGPVYGDNWSDIVKIKSGVTITARVGTAIDAEQSHFTLRPTGKPSAGNNQTYELVYNGTISGMTYTNVVVVSGTVNVAQKDVTAAMIADIPAQTYTGSAIQPKPAVTDGVALVEGTDFTYSYGANTDVAANGKVTITGKGNYKGTADKTFTISRKNINGATINLTAASLPYTGLEQTVSITSVTLTGWTITAGDYDIVGNSNKATNVGSTTLTIRGKGNYAGTATTTWKITAIDPVLANFDVTPALSTAQTYDGAHKTVTVVPKSGVNGMGTVKVYYEATAGITYPKSETAPTDVGTYKVTASVAAGSNYNAKDIDVGTLTINQATGGTLAAYNFQQKYTDLTAKTITPDYSDLPAGQTWTYSTPTPTTSGTAAVTDTSIGADTGVLSYTLTDGAKDNTVKWTVTISSHNYADFTKEVTLTLTNKDDQAALTLTGGTTVVYGETLQLGTSGGSGTGAVTYAVTNGTGEATIDATGKLTPTKAGTVTVTATKAADANYNSVTSAPVTITITKATPTGAPGYTAITAEGKTLADAGLTVGTITPAGTIKWVAENGADLADNTAVEANKSYSWVFTPNETANYETLTGSIQLWHKSTGGRYYYSSSNSSGTATITAVLTAKDAKSATDYTSGIYGLTFRSTADFSGFKGVKVDGKTIGKDNYVAESNNGSIEVYLKAAYLKTLAVGRHTLTIMATGGNASIDFTIGGVNTAPKTFDAGIAVYVTMAVASVTGMAWMGKKRED